MNRRIVEIDREKCTGCGLCIDACHEGAIELVDGKARLVSDVYCDGLGACLGECPADAITITEREAEAFDEQAVSERLADLRRAVVPGKPKCGCPGMAAFAIDRPETAASTASSGVSALSELRQWPIQLALVPVSAPYWQDADLLIAADCAAFAHGGFHPDLLRGKRLVIACPKLDDTGPYLEKLAAIIQQNTIRSVTVAHMEVPCCHALVRLVQAALERSGKDIPFAAKELSVRPT